MSKKILGRRICSNKNCNKGFNLAHIENKEKDVYMPALLPQNGNSTHCDCGSKLIKREDDQEDIIVKRLNIYNNENHACDKFFLI